MTDTSEDVSTRPPSAPGRQLSQITVPTTGTVTGHGRAHYATKPTRGIKKPAAKPAKPAKNDAIRLGQKSRDNTQWLHRIAAVLGSESALRMQAHMASVGTCIAITELKLLSSVCTAFQLTHPEATLTTRQAPLRSLPGSSQLNQPDRLPHRSVSRFRGPGAAFAFPVSESDILGWLRSESTATGLDMSGALEKMEWPEEYLDLYYIHADRDTEAGCRIPVDVVLLTTLSLLSGTNKLYQTLNNRTDKQQKQQQHVLSANVTKYADLKLFFELDVRYHNPWSNTTYAGKVDWGIGFRPGSAQVHATYPPHHHQSRQHRPYLSLLTVVEAKSTATYSQSHIQLLAYMGCIYRQRVASARRTDNSTFGIATDGYKWKFYMIDGRGVGTADTGEAGSDVAANVRCTRELDLNQGDLHLVIAYVIYLLVQAKSLSTPVPSPEKSTRTAGLGSWAAAIRKGTAREDMAATMIGEDDYTVVHPIERQSVLEFEERLELAVAMDETLEQKGGALEGLDVLGTCDSDWAMGEKGGKEEETGPATGSTTADESEEW